ncbi:MAG: GTP pyrophosphokinase [uncultured Campylobacterales bacterium]|uniref:GTP pyrophosphokinase n=1 Tax=uncultured Campylobacterales bacterium TaxID=352960 RepID=A0A6S6T2K9_9BACT|nr:MAG: GTP pyrophosphokinase [uncultured Campylobacterales bacterium]
MKTKNTRPKLNPTDYEHYLTSLIKHIKDKKLDTKRIKKAFYYAGEAHSKQYRQSGEPYIMHPTAVAKIVYDQGLDEDCIISALLHDTVEDTEATIEQVKEIFLPSVASLVDSLSHFTETLNSNDIKDVKTLRKILFSMSQDFRTVYIKIADRLHNMSTLEHMPRDKQIKKAIETKNIYLGLAKNLNLWHWKTLLEDYCLEYLEPEKHKKILLKTKTAKKKNYAELQSLEEELKALLGNDNVKLRRYSLVEISDRLKRDDAYIDINNIYYIEIQTLDKNLAYLDMIKIHQNYKAFTPRFKDFISNPKDNGYEALHTTVFTNLGLIDIKIKSIHSFKNSQKHNQEQWVNKILLREENLQDDKSFHDSIVNEVLSDNITVYSTFGNNIEIPQNSTVLDFILLIYKEKALFIGDIYIADKKVNINTTLKNKDIVEIIFTSTKSKIRLEWFNMLNSYESKRILTDLLGGNQNYQNLFKGYEKLKYWMKVFDLPSLNYIYEGYEQNLQNFSSIEKALITLGQNKISIKEFLVDLISINTFRKVPKYNLYTFALDIKDVNKDEIESIIELLYKNLQESLSIKLQDKHYVLTHKNGVKVKYFFKELSSLLDFLFQAKEKISSNLELKYVL